MLPDWPQICSYVSNIIVKTHYFLDNLSLFAYCLTYVQQAQLVFTSVTVYQPVYLLVYVRNILMYHCNSVTMYRPVYLLVYILVY